ncbi:MAG: MFS transporter [Sarcina sp.]
MKKNIFTKEELVFVILIGLALGFRQIAMNLVTPFVGVYCSSLTYGTLTLAGIALGIFGLVQGLFQIPYGSLSDKYGHKKMILIGVFVMIIGIILATIANNAYLFVFARALQGAGAITSAGYAWLSGSLSFEKRADAISIVGVIVGICSAFALGGGPILREFMPVRGLLVLATITIIILFFLILFFLKDIGKDKNEEKEVKIHPTKKESFHYVKLLMKNKCYFGVIVVAFINGFVGISGFFVIPEFANKIIGSQNMWIIFTPAIIIAIIIMKSTTRFVKSGHGKEMAVVATTCLLIGALLFLDDKNIFVIGLGALALMTGYNILFSLIPTTVNLISNNRFRGIANGSANLSFYVGDFIGTTIVAYLWGKHPTAAIVILIVAALLAVLFTIFMIPTFKKIKTIEG